MDLDALAVFRDVADRSASEREEYYATHQVGDDVRTEVESLLRFDSRTDDSLRVQVSSAARRVLLDSDRGEVRLPAGKDGTSPGRTLPLRSAAGAGAAPADEPGSWFGPYRLRQPLGAGGMGVVWLAEQERPIRRTVALKVVKRGVDSARALSRFESERQTLAILNHPHIAQVFDAGGTPDGRPFFVMEHVGGDPITRFADAHRLTIAERLELFLQVCDAVQHAHQKGILHRDLKPGNILVADLDGRPVAKVIDFGIAKAIGEQLSGETQVTELGVLVGTPEYMSPEQAGVLGVGVDTRSDIFSLGLVLYELLVGAPPFDRSKQAPNAVLEMLRTIRDEEPPRLTRRLASQGEQAAREIADRRQADPRALPGILRGDLEWITARAIEHEPGRRYPSASELAADIRRYLDIEPVAAGPPGLRYRIGKLTRKHRAGAIAAAVAVSITIAASVVSTVFWIRSARAQRETRRQLVSLHVAEGMRLVDQNDHVQALPWLVQALRNEQDGEAAEESHRRRIGMILDRTPALTGVAVFDGDISQAEISFDRTVIALASSDGALRLADPVSAVAVIGRERHSGRINDVAISQDGRWIATAGSDGLARVWNRALETGPPLRHEHQVRALAISPEGASVATVTQDRVVLVWDAAAATVRLTLPHDTAALAVAFSPGGERIATGAGPSVLLWDAATGQRMGGALDHSRPVNHLVFSPDGTRLAVGAGNVLRLWNVADGQPLGAEIVQVNPINQMSFSPDGRWLAWGSAGNVLGIVDARTGSLAVPIMRRQDQVLGVAFSPDSRFLASLELGGYVQVWRTLSWQPEPITVRGGPRTLSVFFDRSGRHIITSGEGELRVWDMAAASAPHPAMGHGTAVRDLTLSPDGKTLLATASVPRAHDSFARVWSAETFEPVTPPLHAAGTVRASFDPRGARIATGGSDGHARIWDARSGEPLGPLLAQKSFVAVLSFSPDGRLLATGGGDGFYEEMSSRPGDIHVWDAATGQSKWSQRVPGAVSALTFSSDGARLEIATLLGDVSFWNASTGVRLPGEVHHGFAVHQIVVSTNGRWSASVSERGVHVRDHAQGDGKWLGPNASSASFDSLNTRLAVGTFDGHVGVWDAATGRGLGWRMKPGGMIYHVRFDRDDRYLATASMDGSTRVWDASGRAVSPRLRHDGPVWSTQFSPDNRTVASGGGGTVRIWPLAQEQGSSEALGRLAEVLSGYRFDESMVPIPLSRAELQRGFDELKKDQPPWFTATAQKEVQWERAAAEWARRTGRADDAVRHLDRVLELEPLRATAWAERASARAEVGRWDGAIADFERAASLRPDDAEYVRDLALARLGARDETGYRRACAVMRARFGATANPDRGQWIARPCALLAPVAGEDVSWLVRAAERSTETEPGGARHLETLGAAMLRAGRPEAAATLRRALQAAPQERGALAFLLLMILDPKPPRPKPCDGSIVDGRLSGAGPPVTWRERVEVATLVRELCAAARP